MGYRQSREEPGGLTSTGGGSMKLRSWLGGLLESGAQLGGHFKGTDSSWQERRGVCQLLAGSLLGCWRPPPSLRDYLCKKTFTSEAS